METHTRAGGDQIPQLLHAAAGLDLITLALRQVLGERVLPEVDAWLAGPPPAAAGAIRYLPPDRSGALVRMDHTSEAARVPGVTGCTVLKEPGATVRFPMRDSLDRLAYCTAVAAEGEAALRAATKAVATLTAVVVDP